MSVDPSELLTIAQAAKRIPLSEPALRSRIDRGEIKCLRLGGHVFLEEKELEQRFGPLYQRSGQTVPREKDCAPLVSGGGRRNRIRSARPWAALPTRCSRSLRRRRSMAND